MILPLNPYLLTSVSKMEDFVRYYTADTGRDPLYLRTNNINLYILMYFGLKMAQKKKKCFELCS